MTKLMKKGVSLLLAIVMAITILPGVGVLATEEDVESKFTVNTVEGAPIIYKKINEEAVEVSGIEPGYIGAATIPEQVQDSSEKSYTVIGIGEEALALQNELLRKVTDVVSAQYSIFYTPVLFASGMVCVYFLNKESFITDVKVPATVQYIEDKAFAYNFKLNTIKIPSHYPPALGEEIFHNCRNISSIETPGSWPEGFFIIDQKDIDDEVIYTVTEFSITGSVLDNNGRPIEGAKVSICSQDGTEITSTYTDSEGLYTISHSDLKGQYKLKVEKDAFTPISKDVVLDSDNIMGAFYDFHLDTAKFTVNTVEGAAITYQATSANTVKVVSGPGAGYSGALTIPNKVEYDGIWYNVTGIGSYAFIYYEKLTTVALPDTLENIEDGAFSCCKFDKMIINCQTPSELGKGVFDYSMEFELAVPSGTEDAYKTAGWPIL